MTFERGVDLWGRAGLGVVVILIGACGPSASPPVEAPRAPACADPCAIVERPGPTCDGARALTSTLVEDLQRCTCRSEVVAVDCAALGQRCLGGACVQGDPCDGVSCDTPPAPSCEGQVALTYPTPGLCQRGSCRYDQTRLDCASLGQRCLGGACVQGDPCDGVSCDTPPAPSCEGQVALTYPTPGLCQQGACMYQTMRTPCDPSTHVCQDGACVSAPVVEIATGAMHTCARRQDGRVLCWGGERLFASRSLTPTFVQGLEDAVQIVSGDAHTCALRLGGDVSCWGDNTSGQLGVSRDSFTSLEPVQVSGLSQITQLWAGGSATCARRQDGAILCWGDMPGSSPAEDRHLPRVVQGLGEVSQLAMNGHICALRPDGRVACWGRNSFGQLGDGTTLSRLGQSTVDAWQVTPVQVMGLEGAVQISAGEEYTCARRQDGSVACWGWNVFGQLGDGTRQDRLTPVGASIDEVAALDASAFRMRTCALRRDASVSCWGLNEHGQLGDGTMTNREVPAQVTGLTQVVELSARGGWHSCARRQSGEVVCWGRNDQGQLGDGSQLDRLIPVRVTGL